MMWYFSLPEHQFFGHICSLSEKEIVGGDYFFWHIFSSSERKIVGGDYFLGTFVHYLRENLWAVINLLDTYIDDIDNFGW